MQTFTSQTISRLPWGATPTSCTQKKSTLPLVVGKRATHCTRTVQEVQEVQEVVAVGSVQEVVAVGWKELRTVHALYRKYRK
jgi:hypothetical protein